MSSSSQHRCDPRGRRQSIALEHPATRMHSRHMTEVSRGTVRRHHAHRHECAWPCGASWSCGRGSGPKAPLRTKRLLSSYSCPTSCPIFAAYSFNVDPCSRASRICSQRLLLAFGQRFCRRHRSPPSSRRIADEGSLGHSDHAGTDGVTGVDTMDPSNLTKQPLPLRGCDACFASARGNRSHDNFVAFVASPPI